MTFCNDNGRGFKPILPPSPERGVLCTLSYFYSHANPNPDPNPYEIPVEVPPDGITGVKRLKQYNSNVYHCLEHPPTHSPEDRTHFLKNIFYYRRTFHSSLSLPRRNSGPGSPSRLFSPLPTTVRAFTFIAFFLHV